MTPLYRRSALFEQRSDNGRGALFNAPYVIGAQTTTTVRRTTGEDGGNLEQRYGREAK